MPLMPRNASADEKSRDAFGLPKLITTLSGHRDAVTGVAFHPAPALSGRTRRRKSDLQQLQLASSSLDGSLTLWNYYVSSSKDEISGSAAKKDQVRAYRFVGHTGPVHRVLYSPSGHLLASCSSDKSVRLWLPNATGDSVVLRGHTGSVRCVDFSRVTRNVDASGQNSESLLLTCSDDKTVKVWSLPDKNFQCSLTGHTNWVRTCKFSPDSPNIAASGGDDKLVKLWDVDRGENFITFNYALKNISSTLAGATQSGSVRDLAFTPSGTALAASGTDGCVRLFDLRSDEMIQHYSISKDGRSSFVDSLSIHPSGNYMLSSNVDRTECCLKVWDLRTCRQLHSVSLEVGRSKSRSDASSCAAFSPDGQSFASGSPNRTVMLWRIDLLDSQIEDEEGLLRADLDTPLRDRPSTAPSDPASTICNVLQKSKPEKINPSSKKNAASRIPTDLERSVPEREYIVQDMVSEDLKDIGPRAGSGSSNGLTGRSSNIMNYFRSLEDPNNTSVATKRMPEVLAGTIDHLVGQVTTLTQTLQLMDRRLSLQEDLMKKLLSEKRQSREMENEENRAPEEDIEVGRSSIGAEAEELLAASMASLFRSNHSGSLPVDGG